MADQMIAALRQRTDELERDGGDLSGGGRGFEPVGQVLNRALARMAAQSDAERGSGDGRSAKRLPGNASAKAPPRGKGQSASADDALEGQPNTWFSAAQMSREMARELFEYRPDGRLFWRDPVGRRHPEAGGELYRKRLDAGPIWTVHIGSRAAVTRYMRRYLVWNWHFGGTDRVLLPVNGDTLDDRIDNIRLGARLEGFAADAPVGLPGAEAVPAAETGVTCPCCGAVAPVLSPNLIARAYQLPPQQEAILARVWQGKGKPVTGEAIIGEMYADDFDGGPEYETARKYFKTQLCLLRQRIEGSGVRIEAAGYQRGFKLVLGPGGAPGAGEGGKPDAVTVADETREG